MSDDDLISLWRDVETPRAEDVLARLDRVNREHRRLNIAAGAVYLIGLLATAAAEALRALETGGALTGIALAAGAGALAQYILARRGLRRRFSERPDDVVAFTLGRVRAGLRAARAIYVLGPSGLVVGYALGAIAGGGLAPPPPAAALALIAAALGFVLVGARLARRRRSEIADLETRAAEEAARTEM